MSEEQQERFCMPMEIAVDLSDSEPGTSTSSVPDSASGIAIGIGDTKVDLQSIVAEHSITQKAQSVQTCQQAPEMTEHKPAPQRTGKRGRKPSRIDSKSKLERSRQSARECRARKKLRYQYLEEVVSSRERAIYTLRDELEMCKKFCKQVDEGKPTQEVLDMIARQQKHKAKLQQQQQQLQQQNKEVKTESA